jgi:putative (di)nucleoside polyphosphate hydrolase
MAPESLDFLRQHLPYRDCVGIALFNRRGDVFIGRRIMGDDPERGPEHGAPWQMPQGGIDKGEDQLEAAHRELYEETNVTSIQLLAEAPAWIYYDLPDADLGVGLKGKYRGQRQRWFAFLFTGDETEIDVTTPGGGQFRAEFDKWRWEDLTQTPDLIIAFKREAYLEVVKAFADIPSELRNG